MSISILHHGHIRLIKKAHKLGNIYVALTSDRELRKFKNIKPELNYSNRKEILLSIKYISGVIKSKAIIDNKFFKKNKFDLLVHGADNKNTVDKKYVKTFKRTKNISSSKIRKIALHNLKKLK